MLLPDGFHRERKKNPTTISLFCPCLEQSISRVSSTSCLSDFQLLTRSCPPLHCLSETLSCLQARYHLCSSLFFLFPLGLSPPILGLILFLLQSLPRSFALSPNVFSVFFSVPCKLCLTILVCTLWPHLKLALNT